MRATLDLFEKDPSLGMVYAQTQMVTEDGTAILAPFPPVGPNKGHPFDLFLQVTSLVNAIII